MSRDTCRTCLEAGGQTGLSNIFRYQDSMKISSKIMSIANITIIQNDGLSDKICNICVHKIDDCISFVRLCESSDRQQREMLVNRDYKKSPSFTDTDDTDLPVKFPECKLFVTDPIILIDEIKATEKPEDNFISKKQQKQQCSTCGKVMSSRFRLKTHLRTHTGERPFQCLQCNKSFALAQNLKVHMRTHTGEKPLHCSVCGKSFAHSAGLATHKRKHTGQTPYQCMLCPRSFRTVGHLQYHVRRHTGEKNFECDSCGKAFITRSDLKQHFLTHTGDRPHSCPICGLRLTRSSHLKRHVQQAHKSQLACDACAMKFSKKAEYEKHKKVHSAENT